MRNAVEISYGMHFCPDTDLVQSQAGSTNMQMPNEGASININLRKLLLKNLSSKWSKRGRKKY